MSGVYRCGSQALYQRLWRAKQKALGLCSHCTAPALDGLRTCRRHIRELRVARAALRRAKKVA
jgi:hypothetical protein